MLIDRLLEGRDEDLGIVFFGELPFQEEAEDVIFTNGHCGCHELLYDFERQ